MLCRPEGWPWGEAGLPDEPSPEKQRKKGSRRKRSSSPVSRDANPTDDDGKSEVVKPVTKRAKRGGGVGAAKVVKRPTRRGEICTQTLSLLSYPACSYQQEIVSKHQQEIVSKHQLFMPKPEQAIQHSRGICICGCRFSNLL